MEGGGAEGRGMEGSHPALLVWEFSSELNGSDCYCSLAF